MIAETSLLDVVRQSSSPAGEAFFPDQDGQHWAVSAMATDSSVVMGRKTRIVQIILRSLCAQRMP